MMARMQLSIAALWRVCLIGCVALLLVAGQTAFAHGEETHGEEPEASEAVSAETPVADDPEGESETVAAPQEPEKVPDASLGALLKNLHPATIHFPIALFIVAGIAEAIAVLRPSSARLTGAVDIMLIAGGAGAVVAAVFGWVHTGIWFGGETAMQVHRWLGTGLAVVGAGLAALGWRSPRRRTMLRVVLSVVVLAVLLQGYLGAELGHGAGHLWAS